VAHLLPGLYDYRLGRHRGREAALVQAGPVRIERFHDDDPGRMEPVREEGWFGINIHRGGAGSRVGAWSAGCQVVQGAAWPDFIGAVQRAGEAGQERFLYLLMEGTDLARTLRVLAAGAAGQGSPPRSSEYGRSRTG
jgi:hypothetical protein